MDSKKEVQHMYLIGDAVIIGTKIVEKWMMNGVRDRKEGSQ